MKKHLLAIGVVCVAFGSAPGGAQAQGRGSGDSVRSGLSGGFAPSIVADILLIPSLTKPQQTKIRTLYFAHRAKSAESMKVMHNLRGSYYQRRGGDEQPPDLGGAKSKSVDGKRRSREAEVEQGMETSSANMRKTLFVSMMKEYEKFQTDLLAVLNEKQKAELKEIAVKARSPDYFKKGHYDIMNADRRRGAGEDRPD